MLAPGRVYPGQTVQVVADFSNASTELLFDPTTVTFKLMSPCGSSTSYVYGADTEVAKLATGEYQASVTVDRPGRWHYQWMITSGTPAVTTMAQGTIVVQDTPFYDGDWNDFGYRWYR
jgi:hypothetical protein